MGHTGSLSLSERISKLTAIKEYGEKQEQTPSAYSAAIGYSETPMLAPAPHSPSLENHEKQSSVIRSPRTKLPGLRGDIWWNSDSNFRQYHSIHITNSVYLPLKHHHYFWFNWHPPTLSHENTAHFPSNLWVFKADEFVEWRGTAV